MREGGELEGEEGRREEGKGGREGGELEGYPVCSCKGKCLNSLGMGLAMILE